MAKKTNKYAGYDPNSGAYDPTGISQYLGLGRPIDFDNKITKSAMFFTLMVVIAVTLWRMNGGVEPGPAVVDALEAGLSFLLCYMIALELDPDRQLGGLIGGGLTLIGYEFLGAGNALAPLWMLVTLRMLNRSSGDRHRIGDNIIIIASAVWLGKEGFWVYPILTAGAYIVESQIQGGYFRSLYLAGISLAGLIVAEFSKQANVLDIIYIGLLCALLILYLPMLRITEYIQAKGDKNGKRLYSKRLMAMGCFYLMGLFGAVFLHGSAAGQQLLPAIMAGIGCGIFLLYSLVRHQVSFKKY